MPRYFPILTDWQLNKIRLFRLENYRNVYFLLLFAGKLFKMCRHFLLNPTFKVSKMSIGLLMDWKSQFELMKKICEFVNKWNCGFVYQWIIDYCLSNCEDLSELRPKDLKIKWIEIIISIEIWSPWSLIQQVTCVQSIYFEMLQTVLKSSPN